MIEPRDTSKRKFHRTVFCVEVISEDPYNPESLEQIAHDICEGDCSGTWNSTHRQEGGGLTAAQWLIGQGSDPGFFQLDHRGNDVED